MRGPMGTSVRLRAPRVSALILSRVLRPLRQP